jgi:hypothetical protein
MSYGAVPLCCARRNRPTRTGGVRLVLGHDFDAEAPGIEDLE